MNKKEQLIKFGYAIQKRRKALNLSVRELANQSGVSAALISKLENALMKNFPKYITIEHLNKSLQFKNNELFELADILFEKKKPNSSKITNWQDELRKFLATSTQLNADNINQALYFIKGLETLQQIEEVDSK